MPSLADTLAHLHAQSEQIVHLSAHNYRSSGPFAQAYLGTPDVLSLIRDADPSESRLFKFIGEESSGNKKVEKRDGGVVTPLKEFKKRPVDAVEGVGVMLKTAMTLVEDYRPGPRARAHTQRLIEAHQVQSERVAELERLIQEATEGNHVAPNALPPSQPTLSVAERIAAEEAALQRLDAQLAPHRPPPIPTSPLNQPAPRSPSPPVQAATYARTPAKTPTSMPHIANSLVNGMTPRRAQPLNRFSPLKLMGTPRAPVGGSKLRDDDGVRRTIFSRASLRSSSNSLKRSTTSRSRSQSPEKQEVDEDQTVKFGFLRQRSVSPEKQMVDEDQTVKFALRQRSVSPEKPVEEEDVEEEHEATPVASPVKIAELPVELGPVKVEGVDLDLEWVSKGTAKVFSTLTEMMRQGTKDGSQVENNPESVVRHLYSISRSDPPPPAPSDTSSISSLSSAPDSSTKAPPITPDTILLAHLLLLLLRSDNGSTTVQSAKENLGSIARARGWEGGDEKASKIIYTAVGKITIKIDRRVAGGKIVFT